MAVITCTSYPAGFGQSTTEAPPPPGDPTPFNPGHYLAPAMNNVLPIVNGVKQGGVTAYSTVLSEIVTHTVFKGIKHRYYWNFFENLTAGVYDFSLLGTHLTDMGTRNKKMHVLIALTITDGNDWTVDPSIAPKYMTNGGSTGTYEGGQWAFVSQVGGKSGFRIRIANTEVKTRFYAMLTAMCTYLKNHAHFDALEAISFTESAQGIAKTGYTVPSATATISSLLGALDVCQSVIPNRLVYQSVNHPIAQSGNVGQNIETILAYLEPKKYGFGTPNIVPGDEDLNGAPNPDGYGEGPIHKMPSYTGAKIPEVQPADYKWSQITLGTGYPYASAGYVNGNDYIPTISQLYNKLLTLDPHYAVWTRDTNTNPQTGVQYHVAMYNYLDTKAGLPAGGLNTTRPTKFPT